MATNEELIKKMYDSQLASTTERMNADKASADAELDRQQKAATKQTDTNMIRTAVESEKAAKSQAELNNAYGLTSGTRAQQRLAQENQLQADLTALRTQQQETDADIERQRSVLAQEFAAAIRQAQAENELGKAQALYAEAQNAEARLLAQQASAASGQYDLEAAELMAENGDYSRLAAIYGLSADELALLNGETGKKPDSEKSGDEPEYEGAESGYSAEDFARGVIERAKALLGIKDATSSKTPTETYPVDSSSVLALGYGPITADALAELVASGEVEEYVENGYTKFRKKSAGTPSLDGVYGVPTPVDIAPKTWYDELVSEFKQKAKQKARDSE